MSGYSYNRNHSPGSRIPLRCSARRCSRCAAWPWPATRNIRRGSDWRDDHRTTDAPSAPTPKQKNDGRAGKRTGHGAEHAPATTTAVVPTPTNTAAQTPPSKARARWTKASRRSRMTNGCAKPGARRLKTPSGMSSSAPTTSTATSTTTARAKPGPSVARPGVKTGYFRELFALGATGYTSHQAAWPGGQGRHPAAQARPAQLRRARRALRRIPAQRRHPPDGRLARPRYAVHQPQRQPHDAQHLRAR